MFESLSEKLKKRPRREEEEIPPFKEYAPEEPVASVAPAPDPVAQPSSVSAGSGNIQMKVVNPTRFEEVTQIADYLLGKCTVVMNMKQLSGDEALRMLDFLNGVTYTMGGEIKQVSQSTFIAAPHDVDVSDGIL